MSLRGFHLVFITFVTIFCASITLWCFFFAPLDSGGGVTFLGVMMALLTFAFPYYGIRFYRKAKGIII